MTMDEAKVANSSKDFSIFGIVVCTGAEDEGIFSAAAETAERGCSAVAVVG